ncbi:MAG TPA: DUF1810 domain-containing protein [Solirubrobacteraceae bacterium]|nr:DUF1810 domain-containing protein [Solirubrobacteraceae bacterium]
MDDPFELERFRSAQAGMYDQALKELRAGRKRGHWIWFVFPQLRGLGRSEMSHRYGIGSLAEARAYLADATLGPRLRECCEALLALPDEADIGAVLGGIDALKLRSSMTLFALADPSEPLLDRVLARWYGGERDDATVRLLDAAER